MTDRRIRHLVCAALLVAIMPSPEDARAQEGAALEPAGFNIDLGGGPVRGPSRIIGLGGAFTALATGIDGAPWNPASYASRPIYELDWFEWEPSVGLSAGSIGTIDLDNNGVPDFSSDASPVDSLVFVELGLRFQFRHFGIGGTFRFETYDIGDDRRPVRFMVGHYGIGYAFLEQQLVLGVGLRTAQFNIDSSGSEELVRFAGTGLEVGGLLRLEGEPWRVGAAARLPVSSGNATGTTAAEGLSLPRTIVLPWEIQGGFAWQLGRRPMNRRWSNPHDVEDRLEGRMHERWRSREAEQAAREAAAGGRGSAVASGSAAQPTDPTWWERERARRAREQRELQDALEQAEQAREQAVAELSREYLILSAEAIVTGKVGDGVGVESFLSQRRQTSGEELTVGVRVGAETEPIHHWLKVRAGGYLEPSRFEGVSFRPHFTLGFDVRLFSWDFFGIFDEFTLRAGAYGDVAPRYNNIGISLGFWH